MPYEGVPSDMIQTRVMLAIAAGNKRAKTDWDKVNAHRLKNVGFRPLTIQEAMSRGFATTGLTASEVQRLVRNAQSAISKDIKAATRELGKLNDSNDPQHTRRNAVMELRHNLENLRGEMKQKVTIEGQLQVHTPGSRLNAVETYYQNFKGAGPRQIAVSGGRVRRTLSDDARRLDANFRSKWVFTLGRDDFYKYGIVPDLKANDLFDEYEEALLHGDYQGVQEAAIAIIDYYGKMRTLYNF